MEAVITETNLHLKLFKRGKVRDTYEFGENLLMVTTDRLSAFDVVFAEGIPYKGIVLNQLSIFWFAELKNVAKSHYLSSFVPSELPKWLHRRSMIVRKATPIPLECVVRGYLAGSAWKEYQEKGEVCGIKLPAGLKESGQLPEPIFTPATKAETGHDQNISEAQARELVGADTLGKVKELSLKLYEKGAKYAANRGIILADTKFEFGYLGDQLMLIDEALTPDSSRYWPADKYEEGKPQESFDKQYVRDYLEKVGWDKQPPAPHLPEEVVKNTAHKYLEAYERLTGKKLEG